MENFVVQHLPVFITLGIIEFILKPFALWRAAKQNERYWFVGLFILNTAGILPLVYLFLSNPKKKSP